MNYASIYPSYLIHRFVKRIGWMSNLFYFIYYYYKIIQWIHYFLNFSLWIYYRIGLCYGTSQNFHNIISLFMNHLSNHEISHNYTYYFRVYWSYQETYYHWINASLVKNYLKVYWSHKETYSHWIKASPVKNYLKFNYSSCV